MNNFGGIVKKNMGTIDRGIRLLVAGILGILVATNVIEGTMMWIAAAIGVVFVLTSLVSVCPLYSVLGIRTCPVPQKD